MHLVRVGCGVVRCAGTNVDKGRKIIAERMVNTDKKIDIQASQAKPPTQTQTQTHPLLSLSLCVCVCVCVCLCDLGHRRLRGGRQGRVRHHPHLTDMLRTTIYACVCVRGVRVGGCCYRTKAYGALEHTLGQALHPPQPITTQPLCLPVCLSLCP